MTGLPAEKQVVAVLLKMNASNPHFDGKAIHVLTGNQVTELVFVTDEAADLSPLRALKGLKQLECHGSGPSKGKLVDLSPLKGLPLTSLGCYYNPNLSDLTPLKGMPLTNLNVGLCNKVGDLSALKGMASLRLLNCGGAQVADLGPLNGMALSTLILGECPVSDLTPPIGMPLGYLPLVGTKSTNFSVLKDSSLSSDPTALARPSGTWQK